MGNWWIFKYKKFPWEKYLTATLVLILACEDEISNTTETSTDNKKVRYKKNCLIYTISLVIISLSLLIFISISCYYYYTRNGIRKNIKYCITMKWMVKKIYSKRDISKLEIVNELLNVT